MWCLAKTVKTYPGVASIDRLGEPPCAHTEATHLPTHDAMESAMNMRSSLTWLTQLALRRAERSAAPDPADMGTAFGLDFSLDPAVRQAEPLWVPGRAESAGAAAESPPAGRQRER